MKWLFPFIIVIIGLAIIFGAIGFCNQNTLQPAQVDTDTIEEVVDSVIDSLAYDTIDADTILTDWDYSVY